MIWKFSENQEAAKRFLVDLATGYREPFLRSQSSRCRRSPAPSAISRDLVANDPAQPPGKYGLLAGAAEWSTNVGFPGYSNAATDEVVRASVISQMFAAAARGETSAEESVRPPRRRSSRSSRSGGSAARYDLAMTGGMAVCSSATWWGRRS